jgi:hypothetical protein
MSSPTIDNNKKKAAYARDDKRKRDDDDDDDESIHVKGSRWTEKEHEKLAKGLARYGKDNQKLAALIPHRSAGSTVIYVTRHYTQLLQDSRKHKNNFDDDDDDDEEEDDKMEEEEDELEKDNDEVQQVTSTPVKQKWTQKEHEKLAKGLARYGKDTKKLAALIPHRSAGSVGAYISRKFDQLVNDSRKYDKATEADEDDSEEEEGADDDNNQPPPKKKAKRDDTEPVGFVASLSRLLSGSWFWPSSMPTDNNNDDDGNDDNDDDGDDGDGDVDDDGKISGISKWDEDEDEDDDLLHLLPDLGIQFLNSINIKSDRELLCAKTFELGEKYALFREENDLYAYSGNGAKSAISHMKKKIRDKAKEMGNTELAELNMDQRRNVNRNKKTFTPRKVKKKVPPTTTTTISDDDILQQSIPQVGVQFLNSINIKSAKVFLTTKTGDLAAKFMSFLEENDMESVTAQYSQVKMSTWKRKVRDAAEAGGYTELANLKIARDGTITW